MSAAKHISSTSRRWCALRSGEKEKCAVGVGNLDRKYQGGGEHVDRLGVLFVGCFST
jgi:hypothetical protein